MSQFAEDFPIGSKVTRNNVEYNARFIEEGVTYIVLGRGTKGTYLGGECIDLAHLDGTKVSPYPDGFACKAFDLCGKTYSQDGQAVLEVLEKSYVPETIDIQPLKWVKPSAYNPIVNWVAEKFISAYAVVRKVLSTFIKHIK